MYFCYIDESGGSEASDVGSGATPVMVLAGLIVDQQRLEALTWDYLRVRCEFYPRAGRRAPRLSDILNEIKGVSVRNNVRSTARNPRRHAIGFMGRVLRVLESHQVRMVGRVWVKAIGQGLDPSATYTSAVQDIATHFERFLTQKRAQGLIVCDGRMHKQDSVVSHSIFTQKMRAHGDPYPHIVELPMFASSRNHVGLQLADHVASALLFPIATRTFCATQCTGPHVDPNYDAIKSRFGVRVGRLEYRYRAGTRHRGGVVVSNRLNSLTRASLFTP